MHFEQHHDVGNNRDAATNWMIHTFHVYVSKLENA